MRAGFLLLCGGRSHRMGTNKALLQWRGKPLLYHAADIGIHFEERILSGSAPDLPIPPGFIQVPDICAGAGVLAGVYSAMLAARSDILVAAPCDMPFYTSYIADYLAEQSLSTGGRAVTIVDPEGRPQPLMAAYPVSAAGLIHQRLDLNEYALRPVLKLLDAVCLPPPPGSDPHHFMNINTAEEWDHLLSIK